MSERLNVYTIDKIDPRLRAVSPHHRQAACYVAAPTQKEACELLDIKPHEFQHYGSVCHNDQLNAVFKAEPRVVFVERSFGVYSRWDEINDPDKAVVIDVRDPDLYGVDIEDPSFGMITVSRFSGDVDLFMVDYPQGHGIAIEITTASLNKTSTRERVSDGRHIVRLEMSEVQWARLLSSFNSGGVPCTLRRYREPITGEFLTPSAPPRHKHDEESFREAITKKATTATESLTQARKALEAVLKGPLRKGDLNAVLDSLQKAEREFTSNLPYVTEEAHSAIATMSENAKSEIDAHIDYSMQRLGERALGARLQEALEAGVDPRSVGQSVALALNPPKEEPAE